MNLLHLKYAVEVERTRSINKAAESLYMGQPNLSRAIKELEESLGITIFKRTSKGISLTPKGEEFIQHAKRIIAQVDEVESMYKSGSCEKQTFSVSVPRAGYVSAAFADFVSELDAEKPIELYYKETNSQRAITNVLQMDYHMGIIRYQTPFEQHFKALLHEKGLTSEVLMEFSYVALMAKSHPLAKREQVSLDDLKGYIELAHPDPYVPSLPLMNIRKAELSDQVDKRVFVFERGSQTELLQQIPGAYMLTSPEPAHLLQDNGLVQLPCDNGGRIYRDVLIYRKGHHFTEIDRKFVSRVRSYCDGILEDVKKDLEKISESY